MLERPNGGYEWSHTHNSKFKTNKFALIDFSMNWQKECPNMHIQGSIICSTPTHWFLGVIVDQELRWNVQVDHTVAKGMAYVFQLCRLSSTAKGLSLRLMRQLYQAITLPKMLYAADLWFTPSFQEGSVELQWGSVGMAKQLTSVQHITALAITRAMRSTATDLLEVHANLPPIPLGLQNTCHRAIVWLATHPSPHPLHSPVCCAANCFVRSHCTSLHRLTRQFSIIPHDLEIILPARKPPQSSNIHRTRIASTKQ